jgi:hypothetical protein
VKPTIGQRNIEPPDVMVWAFIAYLVIALIVSLIGWLIL